MKYFQRIKLRAAILPLVVFGLYACQNKRNQELIKPPPYSRAGRSLPVGDELYSDHSPSIDRSGMKVVFTSSRAPHDGLLRAYKMTIGVDENPVRLTDQESVEERQALLSTQGTFVIFWGWDEALTANIYVQNYSSESLRLEIPTEYVLIENLQFNQSDETQVLYVGTTEGGDRELNILTFSSSDGLPVLVEQKRLEDFSEGESHLRWANHSVFSGIMGFDRSDAGVSLTSRLSTSPTIFSARDMIQLESVGELRSDTLRLGGRGALIVKELRGTSEVIPEGDVTDPDKLGKIYQKSEAGLLDPSGAIYTTISSRQFDVKDAQLTSTSLVGLLGYEAIVCEIPNRDDPAVFYGASLVFDTGSQQSKFFVYVEDDGTLSIKTEAFCALFDYNSGYNAQKVDTEIERMVIANDSGSSIKLVYQTWHRGDREIIHLSFDFDGQTFSNVVFTEVSKNHR